MLEKGLIPLKQGVTMECPGVLNAQPNKLYNKLYGDYDDDDTNVRVI
jgi:hypothetical protein